MKKKLLLLTDALTVAALSVAIFAHKPLTAQEALLLKNVEAIASGENGSVTCCPDPGDECAFPGERPVHNYDEC